MSDAAIVIEVSDKGSATVKRNLDAITASGQKAEKSAFNLGAALKTIGAIEIARRIVNMSDSFVTLRTGIENVTNSAEEYTSTFNRLFETAQRNGVPLEGLTKGFVQLNVSLSESAKKGIDLVKVTDLIARGLAAAGANGATANGVLLQLSQGLATDFKAAGQELNSLIEGAPILAQAIAVQLGGNSATDLKKFAEAGKLTAEVFLKALLAAEEAIYAFAIPETIFRSITRLKNEFLVAIGNSPILQGLMSGLASTLDAVAENFDKITEAVGALAVALTVVLAAKAIPAAILGFNAVTTAIGAMTLATVGFNGAALGAAGIVGVFAAVAAAAYIFRDELTATVIFIVNEAANAVDTLINKLKNLATQASTGLSATSAAIQNQIGLLSDEDYQKKLLQLGKDQNLTIEDGNLALKERIALRDAELQRSLLALGDKGSSSKTLAGIMAGSTGVPDLTGGPTKGQMKAQNQFAKEIESLTESAKSDYEVLAENIAKVNEARDKGMLSEKQALELAIGLRVKYADSISQGDKANQDLTDTLKELVRQNDQFANSVADTFAEFVTGATDAKSAVRSLIKEFISMQAKSAFGGAGIAGLLGAAGSSIFGGGSLFGSQGFLNRAGTVGPNFVGPLPGFASGGSMVIGGNHGIDKNLLSLNGNPVARVGRGETLSVNPNSESGGKQIIVNQTINVSTGVQQTVRAELQRFMPTIKNQAIQGVQEANLRGATA